jgi:hypothetical protein
LTAELEKCCLLCQNCHAASHAASRPTSSVH